MFVKNSQNPIYCDKKFPITVSPNAISQNTQKNQSLLMFEFQNKQTSKKLLYHLQPTEDISDDYLFPMSNRMSFSPTRDSEVDLSRPTDDIDVSPMHKKRLVRSSSDPSINTTDRIPGIPPYPAPPSYQKAVSLNVCRIISPYQRAVRSGVDWLNPVCCVNLFSPTYLFSSTHHNGWMVHGCDNSD